MKREGGFIFSLAARGVGYKWLGGYHLHFISYMIKVWLPSLN